MRQVIIHKADPDETGYWAECPSLPGCLSQGETIEETLENIRDAIQGYIASLQRRGLPIPEELRGIIRQAGLTVDEFRALLD